MISPSTSPTKPGTLYRERRRFTRDRRVPPLQLVGGTDADPGAGLEGPVVSRWDDITDHWITALQAAGRSKGTIRTYLCHLRKIRRLSPSGPEGVTTEDLRKILAHPKWTPETRKSVRTVIGTFFRWLHGEGYVEDDPSLRLDIVTTPPGVARPAPEDVIRDALLEADERLEKMILLGAYAGLRACEIAAVHAKDWDGNGLYVTGKGGKTRYVPIVRADLRRILTSADGYLFPGRIDGHLSAGYVTKLLSAGLAGPWTGHTLRHRCATQMYAGTRDLLAVGAVLGHSRPETTQRYVRQPMDALVAAVNAAA